MQTVEPVEGKDFSPKVFLFVDSTQRAIMSEDERSWREGLYILCSD